MACLHACTSCGRHVRATERVCPFCDAALGDEFINACPRKKVSGKRLSRAAVLFAGAAAVAACGGKEDSSSSSGAIAIPAYGVSPGPARDAAVDAADASEGDDSGGTAVLYGPAVVDAGDDD